MNSLITFLSADISVGFALSIMMVVILIMAAITQVMKSDYEDTIHVMAKDIHETTERQQELIYRLFDTIDDAQVIIDKQQAELKQLRQGNATYQPLSESVEPLTETDKSELGQFTI